MEVGKTAGVVEESHVPKVKGLMCNSPYVKIEKPRHEETEARHNIQLTCTPPYVKVAKASKAADSHDTPKKVETQWNTTSCEPPFVRIKRQDVENTTTRPSRSAELLEFETGNLLQKEWALRNKIAEVTPDYASVQRLASVEKNHPPAKPLRKLSIKESFSKTIGQLPGPNRTEAEISVKTDSRKVVTPKILRSRVPSVSPKSTEASRKTEKEDKKRSFFSALANRGRPRKVEKSFQTTTASVLDSKKRDEKSVKGRKPLIKASPDTADKKRRNSSSSQKNTNPRDTALQDNKNGYTSVEQNHVKSDPASVTEPKSVCQSTVGYRFCYQEHSRRPSSKNENLDGQLNSVVSIETRLDKAPSLPRTTVS